MKSRTVTLSLGSCEVIAPNRFTQMASGPPPASLRLKKPEGEEQTPEELAWVIRVQKAQLTRCVSVINAADGCRWRLVDKPPQECGLEELSLDAVPDGDLELLLAAIEAMREEAAAAAATFRAGVSPQGTAATGHPG